MLRSNFYWLNKLLSDVDPDGRPLGDEFGAFNTLKELTKENKENRSCRWWNNVPQGSVAKEEAKKAQGAKFVGWPKSGLLRITSYPMTLLSMWLTSLWLASQCD